MEIASLSHRFKQHKIFASNLPLLGVHDQFASGSIQCQRWERSLRSFFLAAKHESSEEPCQCIWEQKLLGMEFCSFWMPRNQILNATNAFLLPVAAASNQN